MSVKHIFENLKGRKVYCIYPCVYSFLFSGVLRFLLLSFFFFLSRELPLINLRVDLVAVNYYSFFWYKNILFSPSFLKVIFFGYRILLFHHLKNVVPLRSGSMTSDEKSAVIPVFSIVGFIFSGWFQDFFFIFSFQKLNYDVSCHGCLWFISFGVCSES